MGRVINIWLLKGDGRQKQRRQKKRPIMVKCFSVVLGRIYTERKQKFSLIVIAIIREQHIFFTKTFGNDVALTQCNPALTPPYLCFSIPVVDLDFVAL